MSSARIAVVALSVFATAASAGDLKSKCGASGKLESVAVNQESFKFSGDDPRTLTSLSERKQGEELCRRIQRCLKTPPKVQETTENILDIAAFTKDAERAKQGLEQGQPDAINRLAGLLENCEAALPPSTPRDQRDDDLAGIPLMWKAGINRNKNGVYDREILTSVIRHAILAGVDPYLAMAIKVVEAPPIKNHKIAYHEAYGHIPVDAIGAYSVAGCLPQGRGTTSLIDKKAIAKLRELEKIRIAIANAGMDAEEGDSGAEERQAESKKVDAAINKLYDELGIARDPESRAIAGNEFECFNNPECKGVLRRPKEPLFLDLAAFPGADPALRRTQDVCSEDYGATQAASPQFSTTKPSVCCISVRSSLKEKELIVATRTQLGAKYIEDNVQSCIRAGKKSFSYCVQKFNGLGCFGCTEKMKNDCFYRLEMAKQPIYGARVGDAMASILMTNSEINRLVERETRTLGRQPVSAFCMEKKAGDVSVSAGRFLAEQKSILGGRRACAKYFR